ncbi:AraC family transcriptional regulator [Streptomyces sp. HUCO-GS316]|uniref:helix-turn-helix domain-containing protein n=1 Tax=Streptomyces sp. HUCO-GS316 TaxID=2692198 RepID=UPI001369C504|nr:AraC family transcriptional regulator [Streptomyces sp. HUCO-GS316]MXM68585.1 AraC family transcriptional regulator [Streptomyces sp. HUCO-GS316]
MENLARRAITTIRENYHEPLVLDDLARSVMMSKFHFIRVFQRTTGVTPGRFLSAVRLHEAKSLLIHSPLNVAEISARVGYSSASTFSRRFTASVGLSPTQFRRTGRGHTPEDDPRITPSPVERGPLGSVAGTAHAPGTARSPLYVGLFDSPILQGQPAAWTKLDRAGSFQLKSVPPGTWYLHAVTLGARPTGDQWGDSPLLVGTVGPVDIRADARTRIDVVLRQEDWTRPPILLALPGFGSRPARTRTANGARPAGPCGPEAGYRAPRRRTAADTRLVVV